MKRKPKITLTPGDVYRLPNSDFVTVVLLKTQDGQWMTSGLSGNPGIMFARKPTPTKKMAGDLERHGYVKVGRLTFTINV